jgi:hypothetical protein
MDWMWDIVEQIMHKRVSTIAGLAVLARATAFANAEWWDDEHQQETKQHRYDFNSETLARQLVESVCIAAGVSDLPTDLE